ncbi:hypothetical protein AgCh_011142 [Apium graveolens]
MEGEIKDRFGSQIGDAVSSDNAPKESDTIWYTLSLSDMHSIQRHRPQQTSGISVAHSFPMDFIMPEVRKKKKLIKKKKKSLENMNEGIYGVNGEERTWMMVVTGADDGGRGDDCDRVG